MAINRIPALLLRLCSVRAEKITIDNHRRPAGQVHDRQHVRSSAPPTSDNITSFEGTSEIQRLIIGRAVTGLDVR